MHSRIFILRRVVDGEQLPSERTVEEYDVEEAFVPHIADYVSKENKSEYSEDIRWLTTVNNCFTVSYEGDETFLTLDCDLGKEILRKSYEEFSTELEKLSEEEWLYDISYTRYRLKDILTGDRGFRIIDVDETGWESFNLDDWLRVYCRRNDANTTFKFRIEDIYDYHF